MFRVAVVVVVVVAVVVGGVADGVVVADVAVFVVVVVVVVAVAVAVAGVVGVVVVDVAVGVGVAVGVVGGVVCVGVVVVVGVVVGVVVVVCGLVVELLGTTGECSSDSGAARVIALQHPTLAVCGRQSQRGSSCNGCKVVLLLDQTDPSETWVGATYERMHSVLSRLPSLRLLRRNQMLCTFETS